MTTINIILSINVHSSTLCAQKLQIFVVISSRSLTMPFLNLVKPKTAIISNLMVCFDIQIKKVSVFTLYRTKIKS